MTDHGTERRWQYLYPFGKPEALAEGCRTQADLVTGLLDGLARLPEVGPRHEHHDLAASWSQDALLVGDCLDGWEGLGSGALIYPKASSRATSTLGRCRL